MVYLGATVDASGILAPIIGCCLIHEKYPILMINPCLDRSVGLFFRRSHTSVASKNPAKA